MTSTFEQSHPDEQTLRAFLLGQGNQDQLDELLEHIEHCPECEEALARLDAIDDHFIVSLRGARNLLDSQDPAIFSSDSLEDTDKPSPWDTRAPSDTELRPDDSRAGIVAGFRFARYHIIGKLGRGRMGVVYKAYDQQLGRFIALKVIAPDRIIGPNELERFRNEARAAAKLQHENIVDVYDFDVFQGQHYYSMEYVNGTDLADELARCPLSSRRIAEVLEPVARAMHHAHQLPIIHRDLKPANILLTKDGVPKVADFGLAKQLSNEGSQTVDGTVLGSPAYMPPEQAEGRISSVDKWSDIFSLGAILYEMLTQKPPYRSDSVLETLAEARECSFPVPSHIAKDVDRDLETICLKCLQRDKRDRYENAEELADDIARFRTFRPIKARPIGPVERFYKFIRRRPVVSGITAAFICVAILSGSFVWNANRKRDLQTSFVENVKRANEIIVAEPRLSLSLLNACPPQYRDFYWGYLRNRTTFEESQLLPDEIVSFSKVAISPNGKLVALTDNDGTVALWDLEKNTQQHLPNEENRHINSMSFSPDGKLLAAACSEAVLRLWFVNSGKRIDTAPISEAGSFYSLCFDTDSRRVFAGSSQDGSIRLFKISNANDALELVVTQKLDINSQHDRPVRVSGLANWKETENHSMVAVGTLDGQLQLLQFDIQQQKFRILPDKYTKIQGEAIRSIAFSPHGESIAVLCLQETANTTDNFSLQVFDTGNLAKRYQVWKGRQDLHKIAYQQDEYVTAYDDQGNLLRWQLPYDVYSFKTKAFELGGGFRATFSSEGDLDIWDNSQSPKRIKSPIRNPSFIRKPAGADSLFWVNNYSQIYTADLSDKKTSTERLLYNSGNFVTDLTVSPQGRYLAAVLDNTLGSNDFSSLNLKDLENENAEFRFPKSIEKAGVQRVLFARDVPILAIASSMEIFIFDCFNKRILASYSVPEWKEHPRKVFCISHDGTRLALVLPKGEIQILDTRTSKEISISKLGVTSLAYTSKGNTLAMGTEKGAVAFWFLQGIHVELGEIANAGTGPVHNLAFSKDGKSLVVWSGSNHVHVWKGTPQN